MTLFEVTWTLTDTSPPDTALLPGSVLFQYSLDNGTSWLPTPDPTEVDFTPGQTGTYSWTVPSVDEDKTECLVRVIAIDTAGFALGLTGSTQGHYTAQVSEVFTILND